MHLKVSIGCGEVKWGVGGRGGVSAVMFPVTETLCVPVQSDYQLIFVSVPESEHCYYRMINDLTFRTSLDREIPKVTVVCAPVGQWFAQMLMG